MFGENTGLVHPQTPITLEEAFAWVDEATGGEHDRVAEWIKEMLWQYDDLRNS
jgi:hypothetical protein